MKIKRTNPFNGQPVELDLPVTEAQVVAWEKGMVAQRAFPDLTVDQREFIISGIPPGEFEKNLAVEIDRDSFTEGIVPGDLVSEASDLGWPPGMLPELVKFKTGEVFERKKEIMAGEDVGGWIFEQIDGETSLLIYND